MVYSVLYIFYDSYGFFSEVLHCFCSSVTFSAPRATIPNLTREEKRAWYAIVVVFVSGFPYSPHCKKNCREFFFKF